MSKMDEIAGREGWPGYVPSDMDDFRRGQMQSGSFGDGARRPALALHPWRCDARGAALRRFADPYVTA